MEKTIEEVRLELGEKELNNIIDSLINNIIILFREDVKNEEIERIIIKNKREIYDYILTDDKNTIEKSLFEKLEEFKIDIQKEKEKIKQDIENNKINSMQSHIFAYGKENVKNEIKNAWKQLLNENLYELNNKDREFIKSKLDSIVEETMSKEGSYNEAINSIVTKYFTDWE